MSGEINNREYRKGRLEDIIKKLHAGHTVDQVRGEFQEVFGQVSAEEISHAEQSLINEGMPVEEVQRLCDVHASIFEGSIEDIHSSLPLEVPGHPAHTLKATNRALRKLLAEMRALLPLSDEVSRIALRQKTQRLLGIDSHYKIKENLFFPYMEKYGVTAPPKVMWGVDDEIRQSIRQAGALLEAGDADAMKSALEEALNRVAEMIFKEENILFPMMLETLSPDEWKLIADDSAEYGFCLIDAPRRTPESARAEKTGRAQAAAEGGVRFPTGALKPNEIVGLMDTLPFDITFVDRDGVVKYFSQGKDRIFPRTKAVIGRRVADCHPPASVHIVEKVVSDLKSGAKNHEDFWIKMGERYVLIRYFAVRDENGGYLGTLEVTQDIAPIRAIEGEKRLMSD